MLSKWKSILTNWINCYPTENDEKQQFVTTDSLLIIISNLRENFSLDESKSSALAAETIEEFVAEKFPNFYFENGTLEPSTEDDIYIAASLLLYFACVTSKNINVKNTMCNKLSSNDQATILKFSKCLMEIDAITCKDVESSILEACGQDIPSTSMADCRPRVAETPPAVRSLHSEVRRLQASLDAERFDRNYLQEELSRSNLRIERLAKEKEQLKIDMTNLKAKISDCCGEESEEKSQNNTDTSTKKLLKQIDDLEERLVDTRSQLDDLTHERDVYKNRVDELKTERDKWLGVGQQELSRATQLTEQLETERKNVESLKELIAELKQHNRHNELDASQLECDDPNASVHSFGHNASVCSEACANVVEVQLSEERAKIVVLKHQIQTLQEQLTMITQKSEEERQSFTRIMQEKDSDILDLKHRINEEIEEKNNIKTQYGDEFIKLNNEINELEQKIKDNNENHAKTIEIKLQEIQILQEEKISLAQSLSDETTKLEKTIKNHEATIQQLTSDLYTERNSKQRIKEDCEKEMMKLKDKVLNRNNELVELQDSIFAKGEQIEQLQYSLKKEQENKHQLIKAHETELEQVHLQKSQIKSELSLKYEAIQQLENQLSETNSLVEQLSKERQELQNVNAALNYNLVSMDQLKNELYDEINIKNIEIERLQNEFSNVKTIMLEQESSYRTMLDERQEIISSLQMQIENDSSLRYNLQEEIKKMQESRDALAAELRKLSEQFEQLKVALQEKDKMIDALDLYLNEEKTTNTKNKEDIEALNRKVSDMVTELTKREDELSALKDVSDNQIKIINERDVINNELTTEIDVKTKESNSVKVRNKELNEEVSKLNDDLQKKNDELKVLNNKCMELTGSEKEKISAIIAFEGLLQDELAKYIQLEEKHNALVKSYTESEQRYGELLEKYDKDISKLTTRVQETERILKDLRSKSNKSIEEKDLTIQNLQKEIDNLQTEKHNQEQELSTAIQRLQEKKDNLSQLHEDLKATLIKKEDDIITITSETDKELSAKQKEIHRLEKELECSMNHFNQKQAELEQTQTKMSEALESRECAISDINAQLLEAQEINKEQQSQIKKLLHEAENTNRQLNEVLENLEKEKYRGQEIVHENEVLSDQLNVIKKLVETLQAEITKLNEEKQAKQKEKESVVQEHLRAKETLSEELVEKQIQIATLEEELQRLREEKMAISEEKVSVIAEKDKIHNSLLQEIASKTALMEQNKALVSEKEQLSQKLLEVASSKQNTVQEKNSLAIDKEILAQQLLEEKSTIDVLVNEKQTLVSEKQALISDKNKLSDELISEKSIKEVLENENQTLKHELEKEQIHKCNLEMKIESLQDEIRVMSESIKKSENEIKEINRQKIELKSEIEKLNCDLAEAEVRNSVLNQEKDLLQREKESILKNLTEEKAVRDELETEKKNEKVKLEYINQQQLIELKHKEQELERIGTEFTVLKKQFDDKQELSNKIASTLNMGCTRVLTAIRKEDIENEVLKSLLCNDKYLETPLNEQCDLLVNVADALTSELSLKKNLEKALEHETSAMHELRQLIKQKELQLHELQIENKSLQQTLNDNKSELAKKSETYASSLEEKLRVIHQIQLENQTLNNELNDTKVQLEVKVHSLKEKLTDNENLTEKLKCTYESQIENLNVMSNKLTVYLKDKAMELDALRKEKEKLQQVIEENTKVIKSLEDEVKSVKQSQDKLITDFESERLVLKNMVSVTESVMEDQKIGLDQTILMHEREKQELRQKIDELTKAHEGEIEKLQCVVRETEITLEGLFKDLKEEREFITRIDALKSELEAEANNVKSLLQTKIEEVENIRKENKQMIEQNASLASEISSLNTRVKDLESTNCSLDKALKEAENQLESAKQKDIEIKELMSKCIVIDEKNKILKANLETLHQEKSDMESKFKNAEEKLNKEVEILKNYNLELNKVIEDNKTVISDLEQRIERELKENNERQESDNATILKKCTELEDLQKLMQERDKTIQDLEAELTELRVKAQRAEALEQKLNEKCEVISTVSKQLMEDRMTIDRYEEELRAKKRESELMIRSAGHKENYAHSGHDKHSRHSDKHQVDTSDLTSSIDSTKTITDLEKIIHDKNRTITTLNSEITYLKSIITESETQLMDLRREFEVSQDNCQQLSVQLKKLVQQKNEEIADLKKQVSKMSVTENRASQIIKVSAKYQAIILKRIAEIKSNTVLKELTNFGNNNAEGDLRKSLAGSVTIEDLENFLETTDKHLKRCSEKQAAIQKERDRLLEVNRINESEIINMKKFLTELSVSFKTFNSVKEVYTQKLSRVISVQRTVRREILGLEGHVTDAVMCRLERGYAAVMQDLAECVMNMERWVDRCVSRTISPEKIKQAFTSEVDRASIASGSFHNTSLEVQLDELEKSFQKLLEEIARAHKGEGAKDAHSVTVMEVRAEYEDKLNRMKAKMKQLYQEQIAIFKEKQKEEIAVLERELQKARNKLTESSRAYEEHIRSLSTELWNVGEKYLVKKDEADWLRKKQSDAHGSLMSLQHVPSSSNDEGRYSDVSSLRSLPVQMNAKPKTERRGLHMSDEEGELFDNRFLHELETTPRARSPQPKLRLSELKWRNSLCPPHLKSSYPVETQFSSTIVEEDIKSLGPSTSTQGTKPTRKEVGITAYKKPGPPTPSKQAGRLSATDSELRESIRGEPEPSVAARKTTTPSRIRALFFSSKTDDGTPRKRLSIFRNKK